MAVVLRKIDPREGSGFLGLTLLGEGNDGKWKNMNWNALSQEKSQQ